MREGPLLRSCVTHREGLVSASWLGPPSRTKSENCNERSTGRPRPIPDDGSTRSMTRSIAGTSWSGRGSWCAPTVARPASTDRPSPTSSEYGVARLLDELAADLKDGSYRPLPARRVFIPKPGGARSNGRSRSLRSATASCRRPSKTVIEPIFEADMLECSFGFRPRRSQHDALQVLIDEAWTAGGGSQSRTSRTVSGRSRTTGLMSAIEERIVDRHVLKLLRAMLRAGVMEDGAVRRERERDPAGRGDLALPVQRLPAPA